jgi:Zn-dependent protease with chaperone function
MLVRKDCATAPFFTFSQVRRMKKISAVFSLLLLAACAGPVTMAPQGSRTEILAETERQRELVYEKYQQDQMRIYNISYPLLAANADFCGRATAPSLGMSAWNIYGVNKNYRAAANRIFGIDGRLAVKAVAHNSPAARAGIRAGDVIVAINGQTIPDGDSALKIADQLVRKSGYNRIDFMIERKGRAITTTASPVKACNFPVILDYDSSQINAFADGEKIVITKGIVRFAENDNEIAMIIAHELGHSAMNHVGKMQQNAGIGMLGGLAVDSLLSAAGVGTGRQFSQIGGQMAAQRFSVPFEQEADYIGMYFMERAGYDASGVANFWRRMAAEGQASIAQRTTHPASAERYLAIERAYGEIADKKRRGINLTPNIKQ